MSAASDERYRAALALAYICHSGGNSMLKLLKTMSPEEIWTAPPSRLLAEDVAGAAVQRFVRSRRGQEWREAEGSLKAAGLRFAAFGTSAYPQELTNLSHPPVGLRATLPRLSARGASRW